MFQRTKKAHCLGPTRGSPLGEGTQNRLPLLLERMGRILVIRKGRLPSGNLAPCQNINETQAGGQPHIPRGGNAIFQST